MKLQEETCNKSSVFVSPHPHLDHSNNHEEQEFWGPGVGDIQDVPR